MQRIIAVVACCLLLTSVARGEEKDTLVSRTAVDLSLTLSQSTYSDNWVGGDAGNFAWIGIANLMREIYPQKAWHWRNTLNLAYGQTHAQDPESNKWEKPRKSTDKIDYENLLRYIHWETLPPYAAFRLISQFEDGTVPGHKLYFNPIQLSEAAGLSRQVYKKETDEVLTRVGLSLRQLVQRYFYFPDSANLDWTRTRTSTDGGVEWVTDMSYKIPGSAIAYKGKLTTFKALYYSKSDELKGTTEEDYWKAVDVNWENVFSAQVAKYIVVSLYLQWLYDKELDLGGRFKETLSVGLVWKNF